MEVDDELRYDSLRLQGGDVTWEDLPDTLYSSSLGVTFTKISPINIALGEWRYYEGTLLEDELQHIYIDRDNPTWVWSSGTEVTASGSHLLTFDDNTLADTFSDLYVVDRVPMSRRSTVRWKGHLNPNPDSERTWDVNVTGTEIQAELKYVSDLDILGNPNNPDPKFGYRLTITAYYKTYNGPDDADTIHIEYQWVGWKEGFQNEPNGVYQSYQDSGDKKYVNLA